MEAGFANLLLEYVAQHAPWVVLAMARPFGLTLIFYALAWGHLNSGIIRMAFALAIAMPSIGSGLPAAPVETLETPFLLLLAKELLIGVLFGFLASAPLAIANGAGGIIDMYRGSMMGSPDPASGEITVTANLLVVISLWVFAATGGFWMLSAAIYKSYELWPATNAMPNFSVDQRALWAFIGNLLLSALVLATPMLALMFFSDMMHLISVKFGKQINITHMAFSSKNLLFAALMPVYLVYVYQVMTGDKDAISSALDLMGSLFQ